MPELEAYKNPEYKSPFERYVHVRGNMRWEVDELPVYRLDEVGAASYSRGSPNSHYMWTKLREQYAKGDDSSLDEMLRYVSETCPPDVPVKRYKKAGNSLTKPALITATAFLLIVFIPLMLMVV